MIYFLVGYMGSGKSSIGRVLAKRAGFHFIDMDKEIEKRYGKSISEIFTLEGEDYFRNGERTLLEDIIRGRIDFSGDELVTKERALVENDLGSQTSENVIVATGGGVPCVGDNMELMTAHGVVVYLKMTPNKLLERLRTGKARRPKIAHMDDEQLVEFIKESLAVRSPYYENATMTIDCDGVSDDYICRHIEGFIDHCTKQNSIY